ncbi:MAG TPA: PrsW family glutamic-type intramembrane protease [Aldersonia sp.]
MTSPTAPAPVSTITAPGPNRATTYLLRIAAAMSAVYAVHVVIDVARPPIAYRHKPPIGILADDFPISLKVAFWCMVAAWCVVLVGGATLLLRQRPVGWQFKLAAAAVLLLPFTTISLAELFGHLGTLLICVPSTVFALWAVYRFQRWRRIPVWLFLGAFGWGLLVAFGFGAATNTFVMEYGYNYFHGADMTQPLLQVYDRIDVANNVNAGLAEETGKGAAVALAYLIFRRYFDGLVTGVVLGAAVGLGFNLCESVLYMSAQAAEFQYFFRQSLGLMAAHTAFSAVVGAGFGLASQLTSAGQRRLAITAGLIAAAGTHYANNALLTWYTEESPNWFHAGPTFDILILQPVAVLIVQGPFVLLYVLLLRHGIRDQRVAVAAGLHAEAATGAGAITDAEVPILLNPSRRLWLRIVSLRRYGPATYRTLGRLHAAQFELLSSPTDSRNRPHQQITQHRAALRTALAAAGQRKAAIT